jgi:hypothetical protein
MKHNQTGGWERVTERITHGASKRGDSNCFENPQVVTTRKTYGAERICVVNR